MDSFGTTPTGSDEERREIIRRECMVLEGFASFVVTVPGRANQAHNTTSHAERAVGTVRGYYEHMNGRSPGAALGVDFTRTLRGVGRGLRKLYPVEPTRRIPLLADDMHTIRAVMKLDNLKELVIRPPDDKSRRWDPARDTHIGRITWEDVNPAENCGCKTRVRWRLKPSKTDTGGGKCFEKTFLVDGNRIAISACTFCLLHKRGYKDDWDHINTSLFEDPETGKEVTIAISRKFLEEKVIEAGLLPQNIKGNSLRIGGATAYANSPKSGSITAGVL